MADDLTKVHDYANGILSQLSPSNRAKLAREIVRRLRESQRKRIIAQKQPDGSRFEPRKHLRNKTGQIRRKMFTKLRTIKHMKTKANSDSASVYFINTSARLARIHHYGLRDRINKYGTQAKYPARQLLGINNHDLKIMEHLTINHLAHNL